MIWDIWGYPYNSGHLQMKSCWALPSIPGTLRRMIYGAWTESLTDLPCLESPEARNSPRNYCGFLWGKSSLFVRLIFICDLDPYGGCFRWFRFKHVRT